MEYARGRGKERKRKRLTHSWVKCDEDEITNGGWREQQLIVEKLLTPTRNFP